MKREPLLRFVRVSSSRLGPLLLLLQRAPMVRLLFPEARFISVAGMGEAMKWTVATVAGLGAYDSVSGATTVRQIFPTSGATTVTTSVGSSLTFNYQITGSSPTITTVMNWTITGALPPGATHPVPNTSPSDFITGFPAKAGTYPITVTARAGPSWGNATISQNFTIIVVDPIITTHPASTVISAGGTTTLGVAATGSGLTYQWYRNTLAPAGRINGSTAATYTTPASATETTTYYVAVRDGGIFEISKPAVVTIGTPVITSQPAATTTVTTGGAATLTIGVAGASPTVQWYKGLSGTTTDIVSGATSLTYTTPALTDAAHYWARVTSTTGTVNSETARILTGTPPATFADWRAARFNSTQFADATISGPTADPDGDGFDNNTEYLLGIMPLSRDAPPLTLATTGANVSLGFNAKPATGTGYNGRTRHYALETSTTLLPGSWTSPAGYEDMTGDDQTVSHIVARSSIPTFYRLRIWLTP